MKGNGRREFLTKNVKKGVSGEWGTMTVVMGIPLRQEREGGASSGTRDHSREQDMGEGEGEQPCLRWKKGKSILYWGIKGRKTNQARTRRGGVSMRRKGSRVDHIVVSEAYGVQKAN